MKELNEKDLKIVKEALQHYRDSIKDTRTADMPMSVFRMLHSYSEEVDQVLQTIERGNTDAESSKE